MTDKRSADSAQVALKTEKTNSVSMGLLSGNLRRLYDFRTSSIKKYSIKIKKTKTKSFNVDVSRRVCVSSGKNAERFRALIGLTVLSNETPKKTRRNIQIQKNI